MSTRVSTEETVEKGSGSGCVRDLGSPVGVKE